MERTILSRGREPRSQTTGTRHAFELYPSIRILIPIEFVEKAMKVGGTYQGPFHPPSSPDAIATPLQFILEHRTTQVNSLSGANPRTRTQSNRWGASSGRAGNRTRASEFQWRRGTRSSCWGVSHRESTESCHCAWCRRECSFYIGNRRLQAICYSKTWSLFKQLATQLKNTCKSPPHPLLCAIPHCKLQISLSLSLSTSLLHLPQQQGWWKKWYKNECKCWESGIPGRKGILRPECPLTRMCVRARSGYCLDMGQWRGNRWLVLRRSSGLYSKGQRFPSNFGL